MGEIREIRYLSPVDAAQRFGLMSGSGAGIIVTHNSAAGPPPRLDIPAFSVTALSAGRPT